MAKYVFSAISLVVLLCSCSTTGVELHVGIAASSDAPVQVGVSVVTAVVQPDIPVEIASFVPDKYKQAVAESLKSAGRNSGELVKTLLNAPMEYREAASFLIANMPSADLGSIKAEFLLEHIEYAFKAKNIIPYMKDVPEEVFMHYVLPYRVAEEPKELYRKYFYEQLFSVVKDSANTAEAAHKVNVWLGAPKANGKPRVTFVQTEGRDQGPLETLKAGYGRCEEETIVFISAARSVGIPARSAWTPYWSTCDNNHAWVEIWSDGKWFHLGGCEPSADGRLNSAWFTAPATRAPVVFSACTGVPDETSEKIYRKLPRYCIMNSTQNYSDTCDLDIKVVDPENKPVAGRRVFMYVFNWGGFKAVSSGVTDNDGIARFNTGIGMFLFTTGSDKFSGYSVITTQKGPLSITMALAENAAPDGFLMLKYPVQK